MSLFDPPGPQRAGHAPHDADPVPPEVDDECQRRGHVQRNEEGEVERFVGRLGPDPLIEQANCPSGPVSLPTRAPAPLPPLPPAPGVGPAPSPPPPTPPATTPIPVTITDQAGTSQAILSPRSLFHHANVGEVLKGNHEAAGLA